MKKNKKRIKKVNNSKVVIIFSFLLIIVMLLYTVLNSQMLNSKNITINGNKYIKSEYIIKILDIKDDKNIFRYNINNMEKILLSNKYIDKIKIQRKLPNTLSINITEKDIVANLYNGEIYCYIDKNGTFIDKFGEDNKDDNIIKVNIDYNLDNLQNINFDNKENEKSLLSLIDYIKKESVYKKIKSIDMTNANTINIYTKDDVHVLLNKGEELKYNVSRLAAILSDLQNKNQIGGELDLSTGKYALYRH